MISSLNPTPGHEKPTVFVQVARSGCIYFLVTLGSGFVLEVIRLQVVALHVSEKIAGMLEIPNTLLATIIGARWAVDQCTLPPLPGIRLGVGLIALVLWLIGEWAVVLPLHGLSLSEYFDTREPIAGIAPIGALAVLIVMPFLAGYRWER
ncbi:MAG TPA: hypothetical protein VFX56_10460 [Nitrospira sp.]|nr:hypothetical protein [Nitrospira sp.]